MWPALLLLAVPIAVHLIGRRRARTESFPSLRFVDRTRLLPTHVAPPTDLWLLAVRMLVVAAAVAAFARPSWPRTAPGSTSERIARVIVVDTSASMGRSAPMGGSARDSARAIAQRVADSSSAARIVMAADMSSIIGGSIEWLRKVEGVGRRELVIISDFQVGSVEADVADRLPPQYGLQLRRITVPAESTVSFIVARTPAPVRVTYDIGDGGTAAYFQETDVSAATAPENVELLSGRPETQVRALQAVAAGAGTISGATAETGALASGAGARVAIVYPGHSRREALLARATASSTPEQSRILSALLADAGLSREALRAVSVTPEGNDTSGTPDDALFIVARNAAGDVIVAAGVDTVRAGVPDAASEPRLLVFANVDLLSTASLALVTAVHRATAAPFHAAELDPRTIPDSTLAAWERLPEGETVAGSSLAVTLTWLLVLLLLGIEWLLRRERGSSSAAPAAVERRAA